MQNNKNKLLLEILIFIIFLTSINSSLAITDIMGLQMTFDNSSISGDVNTSIYDSSSGGNLVYEEILNNNISNGEVDLMLGINQDLNLEYGKTYYLDIIANATDLSFNGLDRQQFQSNIGNITGFRISPSNITSDLIADNAIDTASKILDGIITAAKLAFAPLLRTDNVAWLNETTLNDTYVKLDDINNSYALNITFDQYVDWLSGNNTYQKLDDINNSYALNITFDQYVDWLSGNNTYARINEINHFTQNVSFADNITIGNNVLYVDSSSGYIGINTSSPTHTLNVVGDVNVTGDLYLSGFKMGAANLSGGGTINYIPKFISASELANSLLSDDGSTITSAGNFIPSDNSKDLGSASNFWHNLYVDVITATSIGGGSLNASGTNMTSFIIDSDNPTADTENINLIFELGTPIINAVLKWDSTNKRFDFNQDVNMQNNLTVTGNITSLDSIIATNIIRGANNFIVDTSGAVGIGTLYPGSALLNVTGTIDAWAITINGTAVSTSSGAAINPAIS